jgi:catalase
MLQARLFSYPDTHRHRLGVNYQQIPINTPYRARVNNYQRDGFMTVNDNGGSSVNYEPNTFNGPKEKPDAKEAPFEVKGVVGRYAYNHPNDDFIQPGTLYRVVMNEQERTRLINNIVNHLKLVTREDIKIRSVR